MSDQPPPSKPTSSDTSQELLKVGHGQKIMKRLGETRRDVVTTVTTTQAILDLLTPEEGETSPILEALEQTVLGQQSQQILLEKILHRLELIDERLERLEQKPR